MCHVHEKPVTTLLVIKTFELHIEFVRYGFET